MVTWGKNTVNTFNTAAASAPTTTTSSLWSTTPAASPATPTAGTSAFSFSSQPNPIASPAPTTPSLFGTPLSSIPAAPAATAASNAFSQVLGAPQQAALQAHMNAAMNQEKTRLMTQLLQLHAAYSPNPSASNNLNPSSCRFQYIFYDPITQAQRLEKLSLPSYPPKPLHISDEQWYNALTHNPDPEEYIPVVVTSAEGLHSRLVSQQSKMKLHEDYVKRLDETLEKREQINQAIKMQMNVYRKRNQLIRSKLHGILQKFEMCRGKNIPLQESEREALRRLIELAQGVETCVQLLEHVQRDGSNCQRQWEVMKLQRSNISMGYSSDEGALDQGFQEDAMGMLNEHKEAIYKMKKAIRKNERDIGIMKS